MTTAIGYVRVSSKKDEQATSPENQRSMIERYCAVQGWTLARYFEDTATGTSTDGRPDFREIENYVAVHQVDILIIVDMSRLGRNLLDYLLFERDVLNPRGIVLTSVHGANGDTEDVRFMRVIEMSLAEKYSRDLSVKVIRALEEHTQRGYWTGTIPYGYFSSKLGYGRSKGAPDEPCRLIKHPKHWPVVEQIHTYAAHGLSNTAIARELNNQRISGPAGGEWSATAIKRILTGKAYDGYVLNKGRSYPGCHEGVEPALREAATKNRKEYRARRAPLGTFLLPRVITSEYRVIKSGQPAPMYGDYSHGRRRYKMPSPVRAGVQVIEPVTEDALIFNGQVNADALEAAVILPLIEAPIDGKEPAFWNDMCNSADALGIADEVVRLEAQETELRKVYKKARKRLTAALDAGLSAEAPAFAEAKAKAQEHLHLVSSKLETAKTLSSTLINGAGNTKPYETYVSMIRELWESGQRELLAKYLEYIIDRIDVRLDGMQLETHVYLRLEPPKGYRNGEGGFCDLTPQTSPSPALPYTALLALSGTRHLRALTGSRCNRRSP